MEVIVGAIVAICILGEILRRIDQRNERTTRDPEPTRYIDHPANFREE